MYIWIRVSNKHITCIHILSCCRRHRLYVSNSFKVKVSFDWFSKMEIGNTGVCCNTPGSTGCKYQPTVFPSTKKGKSLKTLIMGAGRLFIFNLSDKQGVEEMPNYWVLLEFRIFRFYYWVWLFSTILKALFYLEFSFFIVLQKLSKGNKSGTN